MRVEIKQNEIEFLAEGLNISLVSARNALIKMFHLNSVNNLELIAK